MPGPGEVLISHTAIGLNFLDVYFRSGLYPPPNGLPLIPGGEAAGVVMAVGRGRRLAEARRPRRLYDAARRLCEERVIAADRLVKLPDGDQRRAGRRA